MNWLEVAHNLALRCYRSSLPSLHSPCVMRTNEILTGEMPGCPVLTLLLYEAVIPVVAGKTCFFLADTALHPYGAPFLQPLTCPSGPVAMISRVWALHASSSHCLPSGGRVMETQIRNSLPHLPYLAFHFREFKQAFFFFSAVFISLLKAVITPSKPLT